MNTETLMPIDGIDDWETRIARQDAFWSRAILDRPVTFLEWTERPRPSSPRPAAGLQSRWLDAGFVAASAIESVSRRCFAGDALPRYWPNLGPEIFSAFFGQELHFTEDTSWSEPILHDWDDAEALQFSRESTYWKKINELTDALLAAGKGRFYVGMTDLHPGGDAIAAFRDPEALNVDLLLCPDRVKALLETVNGAYFEVYDHFAGKLESARQPITTWLGIVSSKRWYVPSNDFSCMISKEMFDDVFLPGISAECRHLEASIYHLDGPDALRHLDSILEIPELNALQWVYGAGNGRATDWLHIYHRAQAAGKGIQLGIELDELETICTELRPEGVCMSVAVRNQDEAVAVLKRVSKWT